MSVIPSKNVTFQDATTPELLLYSMPSSICFQKLCTVNKSSVGQSFALVALSSNRKSRWWIIVMYGQQMNVLVIALLQLMMVWFVICPFFVISQHQNGVWRKFPLLPRRLKFHYFHGRSHCLSTSTSVEASMNFMEASTCFHSKTEYSSV